MARPWARLGPCDAQPWALFGPCEAQPCLTHSAPLPLNTGTIERPVFSPQPWPCSSTRTPPHGQNKTPHGQKKNSPYVSGLRSERARRSHPSRHQDLSALEDRSRPPSLAPAHSRAIPRHVFASLSKSNIATELRAEADALSCASATASVHEQDLNSQCLQHLR